MSIYVKQAGTWHEIPSGGGGLSGLGGWADISDPPTSTYTDSAGEKWNVWTFNADGTLNVSKEGLLDVLILGGGGGADANIANGGPGSWIIGTQKIPAGAQPVVVGVGGVGGGGSFNTTPYFGKASSLAGITTGWSSIYNAAMPGLTSSITGTTVTYGQGQSPAPRPNHGDGGKGHTAETGSAGVVIVRRPA